MPFRVSSGPSVGRLVVVSHSASEALAVFRKLQNDDAANVEISHLERGEMSIEEIEELAATEASDAKKPGARAGQLTDD